jgi:hypothetical protein
VTVHGVKFLKIKPTGCTNFSNLFLELNSTYFGQFLCPSSGVFTVHTTNLYDIYPCCVCSEKLLMMDRGTVRNTYFHSKNKFEKLVHLVGFIIRNGERYLLRQNKKYRQGFIQRRTSIFSTLSSNVGTNGTYLVECEIR